MGGDWMMREIDAPPWPGKVSFWNGAGTKGPPICLSPDGKSGCPCH
jgi:hypothetical protein